jgi:F-type H+-transporting ATPase subunit b
MQILSAIPTPQVLASQSWLITPNIGLTVWTLVVFGLCLLILKRAVFPRIREALDERRKVIDDSLDSAARTREQADEVLAEYRERLSEARTQADEIVQRARQIADGHENEARERGQEMVVEAARRAEREIDLATKRALDGIRREVADLTVLAAEKVTRKSLDASDQRRLVEEALGELDFASLAPGGSED